MKKEERRTEQGLVSLVTQLNKAIHRRSSEELDDDSVAVAELDDFDLPPRLSVL